jgi:hypothetical protein
MIDYVTSAAILVQFAFLFYSLGFLARDELWLRCLLLIGTAFYLLYYYNIEEQPLWDAIFTSGILGAINLGMIILLCFERTTFAMDEQTTKTFRSFDTLTPGQFRKVMKLSTTVTVNADTVLSQENEPIDHLYLVTDGTASIQKAGSTHVLSAPLFMGEIGFLLDGNASATTNLQKGSTYTFWQAADLRNLMDGSPAIRNAMIALFSRDLATKLGRSAPTQNGTAINQRA